MPQRVAFQGERGAFSEEAVVAHFGETVEPLPQRSLGDVFRALVTGKAGAAVAAVENSLAGGVQATYDLLRQHDAYVTGEVYLPVHQCLLALPGVTTADVKRVYSHPVALDQCAEFVERLGAEAHAVYDTAGSARMVAEHGWRDAAAIASERAAHLYDLAVLERDVQTMRDNVTRFLVLGREPATRAEGPHKTSLVFATDNRPGALYRALGTFADAGVNLVRLESRPNRIRAFEYFFYVDLEGHREDPAVGEALGDLAEATTFLKVLGSYPRADAA